MDLILNSEMIDALNNFLTEYQLHISGFLGITILTGIFALIVNIGKLGTAGGNAKARSTAIQNILIAGIGLSVLGSISVFYVLFLRSTIF
jgi:hypothetical protein